MIEIAPDTASELAGAALAEDGRLLAEVTWRTRQNHSRELLPTLDWLLSSRGRTKADIHAIFVCLGPGSYSGLRVGVSTAKALAYGMSVPIVGVGRLAADAAPLAAESGPKVMAVHAAGRAELAFAAYERRDGRLLEILAPRLGRREALVEALRPGDFACGELDEATATDLRARQVTLADPVASRVVAVARLGFERLARGDVDDTDGLVPLYLREPAIGPQPPR